MKFDAVVFDMDGVLIDSEPFWFVAERDGMAKVGVDLSPVLYQETMGMRVNEKVQHWSARFPWADTFPDSTDDEIGDGVVNALITQINSDGKAMPGVINALQFFKAKGIKVGLASSSVYRIINAVLDALDLRKYFDDVYSAEDEPLGKPDPGVYLSAARRLGVEPAKCVAIEDSINGVKAAKAAGYTCIAVPDKAAWLHAPERFEIADLVVPSLNDVNDVLLNRL